MYYCNKASLGLDNTITLAVKLINKEKKCLQTNVG